MALGVKKLLQLVKEKNLVENLSQRELENPEGAEMLFPRLTSFKHDLD